MGKFSSRPTVAQMRNNRLFAVYQAINSTRNRIPSLKVFHFLLCWRSSILLFLNWLERVCKCTKIKQRWWTWRFISIVAENKPCAHHKTHLRTMKVYNTRPVSSLKCDTSPPPTHRRVTFQKRLHFLRSRLEAKGYKIMIAPSWTQG